MIALKRFKEAAEELRGVLKDYPGSGYTIESCLAASQAYAAVASETADDEARRALFDEAVLAMNRARKFAKDPGIHAELKVGVARIFERKSAGESTFGDAARAIQYRNEAVAAYQTVIMFRNPGVEAVRPHIEDAYLYCLPLLLEMERWDDALQDAERYLDLFSNGKHVRKIRQYLSRARVSGGKKETPLPDEGEEDDASESPAAPAEEPAAPIAPTTPEEE